MPRAIWKGSVSFGLVNVPVGLYSATEQKDVHFHQLEAKTGKRIRYERVAEGTDREVDYDDIVKGYELTKGAYVTVTPEELESVEPGQTRTIEIEDFVDLHDVDPIHFEKSYYLAPESDRGASKAYALLREVMTRSEKVAIGRFVMRTKQYLGCIRPAGDVLVLETMFFPDEVRDPKDLDLPGRVKLDDRELQAARHLVDALSSEWDPDRYHDTYRERVLELIEAKRKGQEIVVDRREDRPAIGDLMAALEASITDIRSRRGGATSSADELAELTKQELLERASAADISGRSKMTKPELVEALREAS